ncbi:TetR/AcrR family transcriptional regulator [Bacillus sp. S/N-304-OC-R1]|uniref:TetR/AcrR family transcriptional regulator n=1 Tax=Bacillus sp. S/N-304-OC-R1 TaxID=2758034 RepID=UPI001C8E7FFA|nr:TetR/AcrR family transcriptional regulator [Bacillus sp. S/N-304-OC-R1]MBY0123688.1 TetR/AcrR family transcriptional regulator [Bacillus sp. S/N-304-OC-R1]
MYSVFEKQPQEKKELIINVAIEEFVKNGYDKTSTDTITGRAGISKGILFHYFKSKKNLYLYLVNCAIDVLTEETMKALRELSSNDFFERVKEIYLLKRQITGQWIRETQLVTDAFFNPPVAVKAELEKLMQKHLELYQREFMLEHIYLKELIETERLREGVAAETVVNMTMFIVEQLGNKYRALQKANQYNFLDEPDPLVQELNDYLKIIKNGVYKG